MTPISHIPPRTSDFSGKIHTNLDSDLSDKGSSRKNAMEGVRPVPVSSQFKENELTAKSLVVLQDLISWDRLYNRCAMLPGRPKLDLFMTPKEALTKYILDRVARLSKDTVDRIRQAYIKNQASAVNTKSSPAPGQSSRYSPEVLERGISTEEKSPFYLEIEE